MKHRILGAAALLLATQAAGAFAACEREDLQNTVDKYFSALAAHDTKAVSLASGLKMTENGLPVAVGSGFWLSAGDTVLTRSALDSENCGTVTQAVIEEDGRNILFGVRLHLNDQLQIDEIEHILAREEEFAFNPQGVLDTSQQDWEGILPIEARTSRAAMIAGANDYFDMFVAQPAVSVPFSSPCERWENGTKTTRGDCSPKGLVLIHPERRVPVVDSETGVAVAFVFFNGALPDMHMFKFYKGHVHQVQAVIGSRGATGTGWPDDLSLSRRVAPDNEVQAPPLGPQSGN